MGNGEFLLATISEDITERKQAEFELQNAREQLEQRVIERTAELTQANIRLQQEIVERQLLTEQLQAQKDFLQMIIDTNPNVIFAKDREGRYVLANQVLAEICETTVEDVLGKTVTELNFNLADAEQFLSNDQEVFTTLQPKFIPQEICRTLGGDVRWYQTIKKPIFDRESQVTHILGVSTDITALKETQEILNAQKDFLQAVIDTNPNIIYVKDREGKYVLANQVFAKRCGLTLEEIIGKTTAQLHPNQTDAQRFIDEDQEVLATLKPKFIPEEISYTLTGEVRWYQTVKTPLVSPDGQVTQILGVSTDITDRKLAEEQLRQSEVRLRLALDAARMGNWEWNLQTGAIAWSPRLEQLYCLVADSAEIPYETFLEVVHPDDQDLVHEATHYAIEMRQDCDIEYRIIWPDRSIRWIQSKGQIIYDETGQPLRTIGINLDITERKFAEEQLRQREEQLRLALDAAHMGFWERHLESERITCSHHLKQLYGLAPNTSELTYETFLGMVHPEDRDRLRQADQQAIEIGEKCDIEFRIVRPDGSIRWMESKGQVVYTEEDEPVRMTGINLDITERKQAEMQIQASLREKEVLLQEIHHRVKNNLQVISSLLDLQSQYIEERSTLDLFRESQNRVKSMALVHEKLYQSQDFASINFIEYIENLTSYLFQVYAVVAGTIALELNIDKVNLTIDTAIPCGLIISELVSNALKYAFPSGRQGTIQVALRAESGDYYTIVVKDNGIGLPTNLNLKTSKSLGLQLVNVLTEQLEGTLELDCSSGTEFTIRFPPGNC